MVEYATRRLGVDGGAQRGIMFRQHQDILHCVTKGGLYIYCWNLFYFYDALDKKTGVGFIHYAMSTVVVLEVFLLYFTILIAVCGGL